MPLSVLDGGKWNTVTLYSLRNLGKSVGKQDVLSVRMNAVSK